MIVIIGSDVDAFVVRRCHSRRDRGRRFERGATKCQCQQKDRAADPSCSPDSVRRPSLVLYRVMHDLLNGTIESLGLERLTISQLRGLLRAIKHEHNDSMIDLSDMGLSENESSEELFAEEADLPESAGQILYTKFSFGLALLLLTV
uniref:Uncharacterized protein n=1 Tax=Plectus sambesii TaxID=2011161 RepID=A0A914V8G8_9BILA